MNIEQEYRAYVRRRIATGKFTRLIGRTRQRQAWHEALVSPRGISCREKLGDEDKRKRQEAYGFMAEKWSKFPEGRIHPTIARLYFGNAIAKPAGYLPA